MSRLAVRDTDKGFRALVRRILGLRKPMITVGIHAEEGAQQEGALTVLDVATINEFGLGVPERSFIRAWFDSSKVQNRNTMSALARSVVQGKITRDQALDQFGQRLVGDIQTRIAKGIDPPNAPATIKRKGSSKPLIDTGQLRASVTYRVQG